MKTTALRHHRYQEQAEWTAGLRSYLLKLTEIRPDSHILEIGCGTGAVLTSLVKNGYTQVYGLDLSFSDLHSARLSLSSPRPLICADAAAAPLTDNCFDAVVCHFLLLWLKHPLQTLAEVRRILKPGGWFMAFAEPDYDSRVDYPPELEEIGRLQTESLIRQGIDPSAGRKMAAFLTQTAFSDIHWGILGNEWPPANNSPASAGEQHTLRYDLEQLALPPPTIENLLQQREKILQNPAAVQTVPAWWAIAKKQCSKQPV